MHCFIPRFRLKTNQHPNWMSSQMQHHSNCLRTLRYNKKPSRSDLCKEKLLMKPNWSMTLLGKRIC